MKSGEFSSVLKAYAEMLGVVGAPALRSQIATIARIFDVDSATTVATVAKRVSSSRISEADGRPNLGDVAHLLSALRGLLKKAAKAALLNDMAIVEKVLQDRASMDIDRFARAACEIVGPRPNGGRGAQPAQNDLVLQYKMKLEAALGDEEKFRDAMNDLRTNQSMGKLEIVALTKEMTGSGARTIDAALKKIWNRHKALIVFKAKSRATRGRSAA